MFNHLSSRNPKPLRTLYQRMEGEAQSRSLNLYQCIAPIYPPIQVLIQGFQSHIGFNLRIQPKNLLNLFRASRNPQLRTVEAGGLPESSLDHGGVRALAGRSKLPVSEI